MISSLRTIAEIVDPVTPPLSLRTLAARHRWTGDVSADNVPRPLASAAAIARRHHEPADAARLLAYNTQLLWGFEIPMSTLDLIELIDAAGMDLLTLYVNLEITLPGHDRQAGLDIAQKLAEWVGVEGLANFLGVASKIVGYINECLDTTTFGALGRDHQLGRCDLRHGRECRGPQQSHGRVPGVRQGAFQAP